MKRVGVALCTYNGERFLKEQLETIDQQTFPVDSIVIADDGSSDATKTIVSEFSHRARTLPQWIEANREASGQVNSLGVSRNFERSMRALVEENIEIVALSDQDDRWHIDKLESVSQFFREQKVLLVHTDADLVDAAGSPWGSTLFQYLEMTPAERASEESGHAFDALLRRNLVTGATVVFRRELLEHALPIPDQWLHDEWLGIIAAALDGVAVLNKPTIDYRQHGTNEIGVQKPTLLHKISAVMAARGDKNRVLSQRFSVLANRLELLTPRVPAEYIRAAREKADFELDRSRLPKARVLRLIPVFRLAFAGKYGRYASRGRADIVRDLIQPA